MWTFAALLESLWQSSIKRSKSESRMAIPAATARLVYVNFLAKARSRLCHRRKPFAEFTFAFSLQLSSGNINLRHFGGDPIIVKNFELCAKIFRRLRLHVIRTRAERIGALD